MSKGMKWFLLAVAAGAAWAIGSHLVDRYWPTTIGVDKNKTNT